MPELNIERQHTLGLAGARAVAERWREQAEQEWGMACVCEPGEATDRMRFERSGVSGELTLSETRFDLHLNLGFLLGAYSGKIEEKIRSNLDTLLGPAARFDVIPGLTGYP
jgi:putative polyhydroxyalkanoate system protein